MKTEFYPINLQTWARGQQFYYFSKMAPTGYSLTTAVDVTGMRADLKEHDIKFFPAYIWLVTKMLNQQIEFKVAVKDEILGYWDTLTPLYAAFHDDDKTFSFMWTDYDDDFSVFYGNYLKNQQQYGDNHGVLSQSDKTPPVNSYTVSCVPWIEFSHFAIHSYGNNAYYFPSIEAGKFFEQEGKVKMPLSITAHHATTDGWHIKLFLDSLQYAMNNTGEWLRGFHTRGYRVPGYT